MDLRSQDLSKKRFCWGIALVWLPSVPIILTAVNSFRRISEQKAIGLGAVAGGLVEIYLPVVILLTVGVEVAAIVLLIRSFSRFQVGRTLVSVLSIGWSMLVIASFGLLIWGFYIGRTRLPH